MRRLTATVLAAALCVPAAAAAGMRARYGGELRVLLPAAPQSWDPAQLMSASDVAVAGLLYERLLRLAPDGTLLPELAVAVPEPEAGGKAFRFRLRQGARFQDGSPLGARQVVASLTRLIDSPAGSPFSALALPIVGAADGTGRLSGLVAGEDGDVHVSLAFAYPELPRALAHPAASILPSDWSPARPGGSGPFGPAPAADAEPRLAAFADCGQGRPFADAVRVRAVRPRAAARALSLGEADLALMPIAGRQGAEGPALFATYLALNPARLGAHTQALRQAVEATVDVADLTRVFVRAPAVPLHGLLPPALDASAAPRPRPAPAALPAGMQVSLIYDASVDDQRAVAERLQIKLHDAGVRVQVKRLGRAELRRALAEGRHELALVGFAALPEPGMALAQLVHFASGREAAREVLRAVGAGADPAARRALASARAAQLLPQLPLIPLYAQAPVIVARPGVTSVAFDGCGVPAVADAWFVEGRRGR